MAPESPALGLFQLVLSLAQIGTGITLFAWGLPLRNRAVLRTSVATLAFFAYIALMILTFLPLVATDQSLLSVYVFLFFSGVLAFGVWSLTFVCDTSVWVALYCCTAGYIVQNLASGLEATIELVLQTVGLRATGFLPSLVGALVSTAIVYVPVYLLIARPAARHGFISIEDRGMLFALLFAIVAVIAFDVLNKYIEGMGIALPAVLAYRAVHGVVCVFALVMVYEILFRRKVEAERDLLEQLDAQRERQWELSRENVEAINIKCHDIRHQIRALRDGGAAVDAEVLDDIAREVRVYDSSVRTGNEALDTILSEKGLVCEREGISFTVIADGAALSFMRPADLYALFGNAVDNAIEAVRQLDDPGLRSISLDVRRVAGMVRIHEENPFVGSLNLGSDGLPNTSKGDGANHGFGTRSMRMVVERYGGTFTVRAQDGVFHLNALVPEPE